MLDLVDMSAIADRAGTTPGMVRQWRYRHADFPAPLVALAIGPIWDWPAVRDWLARPRRPGRPRRIGISAYARIGKQPGGGLDKGRYAGASCPP